MVSRFFCLFIFTISLFVLSNDKTSGAEPVFETDIAPLLIKRCIECHQARNPSGNLVLTTKEGLLKGGDSGPVVNFDSPKESYLLERIHDSEMPPEIKGLPQKLPPDEIALLERWIAAGAEWPKKRTLDWFERTNDVRAGRDWWSLQPIHRPNIPKLKTTRQPDNPIDAFIIAQLEKQKLSPAPPADKTTLIKRVYYDLTGLPPSHEQIENFKKDSSPQAWEKIIDTLLESPQYGERWGRYWLDLVRYADTSGYERDQEKLFAWKYRDWVVNAFNSDMPYQQFILEQLAGDEIPDSNKQSVIATGFLRLGTWNDEPNDPGDYQYERLEDLIHTTSSAFIGMTVKCARCHEHKFDAITQEDYYRMGTAFWAGPIGARSSKFLGGSNPEELGYKDVLGWTDLNSKPRPLHLLKNGERDHPLQKVAPASLSIIPKLERTFDSPPEKAKTSHRRLQLARWISDPKNPLAARVMVNRLWLHHFGNGIVRTPNNFGFLADPPTHPELLDWLAKEFIDGGWTIKRMHKMILTSKTWKQSSLHPKLAKQNQQDAGNRNWWRAERRRLDAEALRDSMLSAAGELNLQIGGPGFRPTISPEALEGLSMKSKAWNASTPEEQSRRSLYIYFKRGLLPPMMTTFDLCDSTQSCGKRDITTVPTQALTLMNNSFVHNRSNKIARDILDNQSDQPSQVRKLWIKVYGREPETDEIKLALHHLSVQTKRFKQVEYQQAKELVKNIENVNDSLVLHLRSDQGVKTDSTGRVSLWEDQSGHNHHAWQSDIKHQPQFKNNTLNGQQFLSFDGKGRFFHLKGSLLKNQECTIIAVVNDKGTPGHRTILSNWNGTAGNSTTSLFLGLTAKETVRFSDNFSNAGLIKKRNNPFIITAINSNSQSSVFTNSQEISSRDSSLSFRNLSTDWVIAQQGNINGEFWNGDIAEIRVYSKALTTEERLSVEREISRHHTIALNVINKSQIHTPALRAFESLAHVLLNSNEFLYVD
jgi:Protein of unknown function (DUF1553)/Protein of unknown function (DUF1549)/Planctomycete cytochrome C